MIKLSIDGIKFNLKTWNEVLQFISFTSKTGKHTYFIEDLGEQED